LGDVREILSLFPFLLLPTPLKERALLSGTQPVEHPEEIPGLLEAFGAFLLFTDNEYKISNDPPLNVQVSTLDTAIIEFYAVLHQTRYLDTFMKEQNSFDTQTIMTFFDINRRPLKLYPAQAIFFTNSDKIADALKIWQALNDADKSNSSKWALEASYTLQLVRQHRILDEHLEWIKARSTTAAVNALLYPSVEVLYACDWIQANCPTYILRFYDFIVQQTGQNSPITTLMQDGLLGLIPTVRLELSLMIYSDLAL
jgi:hypothetical protein